MQDRKKNVLANGSWVNTSPIKRLTIPQSISIKGTSPNARTQLEHRVLERRCSNRDLRVEASQEDWVRERPSQCLLLSFELGAVERSEKVELEECCWKGRHERHEISQVLCDRDGSVEGGGVE